MEKLLFINACVRGPEISRTYRLCRVFLDEYAAIRPGIAPEEVDLTKELLPCYDGAAVNRREKMIDDSKTDDAIFRYANQFALADKIVVGAPYWDLSFPAVLKAYVENICVRNVTFCNTPTGVAGLCRAEKLVYITTVGGYAGKFDLGTEYFKGICDMLGIKQFESICAEGLDIETNDPLRIMETAEKEASLAARQF